MFEAYNLHLPLLAALPKLNARQPVYSRHNLAHVPAVVLAALLSWMVNLPRLFSILPVKCSSSEQVRTAVALGVTGVGVTAPPPPRLPPPPPAAAERGLHSAGLLYFSRMLVLAPSLHRCSADDHPHGPAQSMAHRVASQFTAAGVVGADAGVPKRYACGRLHTTRWLSCSHRTSFISRGSPWLEPMTMHFSCDAALGPLSTRSVGSPARHGQKSKGEASSYRKFRQFRMSRSSFRTSTWLHWLSRISDVDVRPPSTQVLVLRLHPHGWLFSPTHSCRQERAHAIRSHRFLHSGWDPCITRLAPSQRPWRLLIPWERTKSRSPGECSDNKFQPWPGSIVRQKVCALVYGRRISE